MIVHLTDVLHVTKFLTEWLYEKTVLPTYKKKKKRKYLWILRHEKITHEQKQLLA